MTLHQRISPDLLRQRFTVADIVSLQAQGVIDEREKFELIEGEVIPMAAMKTSAHESMKSLLVRELILAVERSIGVFIEPSVTLNDDTFVDPDIAVWPRGIGAQDVRGHDVLLLIEVAVSSIGYDLRVKAPLYAAAGVRDYWVVDALRGTVRMHRGPEHGQYREIVDCGPDDPVTALAIPAFTVMLGQLD